MQEISADYGGVPDSLQGGVTPPADTQESVPPKLRIMLIGLRREVADNVTDARERTYAKHHVIAGRVVEGRAPTRPPAHR